MKIPAKLKQILPYFRYVIAAALVLVALKFFVKPDDLKTIQDITPSDTIIITVLGYIAYVVGGFQYIYLIKDKAKIELSLIDKLTLPVIVGLWGIIIPFQGSIIYLLSFLKFKYKTQVSTSLAIVMFSYLISVVLTGMAGSIYAFVAHDSNLTKIFFAVLLISPVFIIPINWVISKLKLNSKNFIGKALSFIKSTSNDLAELLHKPQTTLAVFLINIVHTLALAAWYYYIAKALGMELSALELLIYTLFQKLSIIFKLTPGNIGVEELVTGGAFAIIGSSTSGAILMTLVARAASLILMLTIGVAGTIYNTSFFKLGDINKKAKPSAS